jgi:hypothetical protein
MQRRYQWSRAHAFLTIAVLGAATPSACTLKATPPVEGSSGEGGSGAGGEGGRSQAGGKGGGAAAAGSGRGGGNNSSGGSAGSTIGQAGDEGSAGEPGAGGGTQESGGSAGMDGTGGSDSTGGTDAGGGSSGSGTGGRAAAGGAPACTDCGGDCVDLMTNEEHCGKCEYPCVNGRQCESGRCTPAWQPMSSVGAPASRLNHAAAFVAGKYVVLGGCAEWNGPALDSTGAYDPASDTWTATAPLKSARAHHAAVSTGTQIYTFGGLSTCANASTLGPGLERFVPNNFSGTWTTITATGEPSLRYNTNITWAGGTVLVYGGSALDLPTSATGARFAPGSSEWTDASCELTFCDRLSVGMFTEGNVVHFMGGEYNPTYPTYTGSSARATSGFSYDLDTGMWSTWPHPDNTPIIAGGPAADDGRRLYFPTGDAETHIYDREVGWLPIDYSVPPPGMCVPSSAYVWSGTEVIGWGASCTVGADPVGGRYQPAAPIF